MRLIFTLLGSFLVIQVVSAAEVLTAFAEQVANNEGEGLVYVSGQVRKQPESATGETASQPVLMTTGFSVLGNGAGVDTSSLLPAANVEVRFWQADRPDIIYRAQTDTNGSYVIGLDNGVWLGEACGSDTGFYPARWQLSVENDRLVSMQAITQKIIQIDSILPSDLVQQDSVVTINGQGFGCSGSLRFIYSNSVNRCGVAQDIEYDHEIIQVSEFISRYDTQIRFVLPELDDNREVMKHIATVQYYQGAIVSEPVIIGEQVMPPFNNQLLCDNQQPVVDVPSISVVTDSSGQAIVAPLAIQSSAGDRDTQSTDTKALTEKDVTSSWNNVRSGFLPRSVKRRLK